jgi:hypothetical protein
MNLENINSSYLIISSDKIDDIISNLYTMDYSLVEMKSYDGEYHDAIIAYNNGIDNDSLRESALTILDRLNQEFFIIKYKGEKSPKRLFKNGSERLLEVSMYNTDDNLSYIYKGLSFSFLETKRYWIPKNKEDFRVGMVVEFLSNNKWTEKLVENPLEEWENVYKLMLKYNKIRVMSR